MDWMNNQFQIKILVRQNLLLADQLAKCRVQNTSFKNQQTAVLRHFYSFITTLQSKGIQLSNQQLSAFMGSVNEIINKRQNSLSQLLPAIISINQSYGQNVPIPQKMLGSKQLEYNVSQRCSFLSVENQLLKRRIGLLNSYQQSAIDRVLEGEHLCYCGGVSLNYKRQIYKAKEEACKRQQAMRSQGMQVQIKNESKCVFQESQAYKVLVSRLVRSQKKVFELKMKSKVTLDAVLGSQPFHLLREQYKQLMIFNSQLINKLNIHYKHLKQIENERLAQIMTLLEIKNTYHVQTQSSSIVQNTELGKRILQIYQLIDQYLALHEEYTNEAVTPTNRLQRDNSNQLESGKQQVIKFLHFILCSFRREGFQAFCQSNDINVKSTIDKMSKIKANYSNLVQDNKALRRKSQELNKQVIGLRKRLRKQNRQSASSKEIDQLKGIKRKLEEVEATISSIRFQMGQAKAKQTFTRAKQARNRQLLQCQLAFWGQKSNEVKLMIENKVELQQMVELQQIKFKQEEGKHLASIEGLKYSLQNMKKQNEQLREEVKKLIEERVKVKLEQDISKGKFSNLPALNQLKQQLQMYKKKISCCCHRSNLATVILKDCHHILCKECFVSIIATRKRCCPICNAKITEREPYQFKYN